MKRNIFLSVFYILITVFSESVYGAIPTWSVVPNDYQYSLTITAVLNMDGVMANQTTDKVGAFVNGVCRGVGSPTTTTTSGGANLVFLQVYSNSISGEDITFKMYDASGDLQFDAINIVSFQSDAALGSVSDPYVITTNHDPTDISLSSMEIMEGLETGSDIGKLTATDPDGGVINFTYSLVTGIGADDNASFVIHDDKLQSAVVFDYDSKSVYTVLIEVNDGKGGVFQKQFTIHIVPDPDEFSALNYISPNNDGKNDVWKIKNPEIYKDYQLSIFNDAGIVMYSTADYQNDWEGTYNGKALPTGIYYFVMKSPEGKKFTGSITLNR
jgi:gliding motility-associated-like protein